MTTKNISPIQFASIIGVQRSGISHILSGRNKPSLDFIQKILAKFPDINADWLVQGIGEMQKGDKTNQVEKKPMIPAQSQKEIMHAQPDLFSAGSVISNAKPPVIHESNSPATIQQPVEKEAVKQVDISLRPANGEMGFEVPTIAEEREWVKIIVVYDDDSFKVMRAQKKRD
jgi:transcriptional regulator with XRE-family HTH domain